MKLYILCMTVLCIVMDCYGLPDGAPESACVRLTPIHKRSNGESYKPQERESPFEISAVKSGNKIRVTISSPIGEKFQGFILQPRSSNDPNKFIDGEFTTNEESKAINCFNSNKNTLTHVKSDPKTEVTTEWIPKETVSEAIIFRATVAKTFDVFWTKIDSLVEMSDSEKDSMYHGCLATKGCFGLPSDCVQRTDCEVLLSYTKSPDGIRFGLQGFLQSSKYMAMALSEDAQMGSDSVTECIRDGSNVAARESWNEGKSNTNTKELPKDRYEGSYTNGLTSCFWIQPYSTESNGHTFDLTSKNYFILLAKGDVTAERLKYHSERLPSSKAINFTVFENIEGDGVSVSTKIHDKSTEFQHLPTTGETEANSASTNKIPPSEASETTTKPNCSSQLSFSLFLLAIFGLFYSTEGFLLENFGLI